MSFKFTLRSSQLRAAQQSSAGTLPPPLGASGCSGQSCDTHQGISSPFQFEPGHLALHSLSLAAMVIFTPLHLSLGAMHQAPLPSLKHPARVKYPISRHLPAASRAQLPISSAPFPRHTQGSSLLLFHGAKGRLGHPWGAEPAGCPGGGTGVLEAPCCPQVEHRGDHVHPAGRLAALLAPQADADAAHDHERRLPVRLPGVGRPLRHRQGPGGCLGWENLEWRGCCRALG